jgi:hypothetical protein
VVEDDELVALAALGGDVPGLERSAIIRRDIEVVPSGYPVIIRSLKIKLRSGLTMLATFLTLA